MVRDYKTNKGQNIFDIANSELGGIDNIYNGILKVNNISINDTLIDNLNIDYDFYTSKIIQIELNVNKNLNKISINCLKGQSVYDVVLSVYSSLDNVINFVRNNNVISLNELDFSGKVVTFDENNLTSNYKIFKNKGYKFTSIYMPNFDENIVWDGIYDIWDGNFDLSY
jgi:hypothetical protein